MLLSIPEMWLALVLLSASTGAAYLIATRLLGLAEYGAVAGTLIGGFGICFAILAVWDRLLRRSKGRIDQ